jgi:hypothetical protein
MDRCPFCNQERTTGGCGCASLTRPVVAPVAPLQGWQCPACGGGLSPFVNRCPCVPMGNAFRVTTTTTTNEPPTPEER